MNERRLPLAEICPHCGAANSEHGYEHLARECYPKQLRQLEKIRAAADAVCWFDWSGNDSDAVAAIDALRAIIRLPEWKTA